MRAILILAACLLFSPFAQAQTRQYVSDEMFVPVRSGAGNQYRIIYSRLSTGTEISLLEKSADGEWAHIKLASGTEGWVPAQYLSNSPPARTQLESAQTKLAATSERARALEAELAALRSEHGGMSTQTEQLANERDACMEELQTLKTLSADAVNLNDRYRELLARHGMMQTERDALQAENDSLKADRTISHWLFGAGLLIAGMLLMLILPSLRPKKRNSDWVN